MLFDMAAQMKTRVVNKLQRGDKVTGITTDVIIRGRGKKKGCSSFKDVEKKKFSAMFRSAGWGHGKKKFNLLFMELLVKLSNANSFVFFFVPGCFHAT